MKRYKKDFVSAIDHCAYQLKLGNSSWAKEVRMEGKKIYVRPVITFGKGEMEIHLYNKYGILSDGSYSYETLSIEVSDELLHSKEDLMAEVYYRIVNNISRFY